jgi:hypothetical protein
MVMGKLGPNLQPFFVSCTAIPSDDTYDATLDRMYGGKLYLLKTLNVSYYPLLIIPSTKSLNYFIR